MSINPRDFNPATDLIGKLPNVFHEEPGKNVGRVFTNKHLSKVLGPLASMHPEWKFFLEEPYRVYTRLGPEHAPIDPDDSPVLSDIFTELRISEGSTILGVVSIAQRGENYVFRVNNRRIDDARKRGNGFNTKDAARAIAEIRRTFYKPTNMEKLKLSEEVTTNTMNRLWMEADNGYDNAWDEARADIAAQFHAAFDGLPDAVKAEPKVKKVQETYLHLESIRNMRNAWEKTTSGGASLVVLDGGKYIVRSSDDEVQIYSPDTVPEHIRMKLGMLKLAEEKQCIDNIGVKVSDEVFLVYPN